MEKDILILVNGPTQGLDDTTLTAKAEYSFNFSEQQNKFCLALHYNEVNIYLFVNSAEIYKFKTEDSELNKAPLHLCNVSKDFSADNMKNNGLYWYIFDFSVDYDTIDVDNILDNHRYLMVGNNIKYCLDYLNKYFLRY